MATETKEKDSNKVLLQLPSELLTTIDEFVKKELKTGNRNDFIRKALVFTLSKKDEFLNSEAFFEATLSPEDLKKLNVLKDQHDTLLKYKDMVVNDKANPDSVKKLAHLIYLTGQMVYTANE